MGFLAKQPGVLPRLVSCLPLSSYISAMRATTYYHSVSWFSLFLGLLGLCVASAAAATTSWGFSEATVSVSSKGDGVGGKSSEKYLHHPDTVHVRRLTPYRLLERKALSTPISLGAADTLKVVLTAQEGRTPKQPHQTFLLLKDPASNLDISYPFNVKNNGKAKLELVGARRRRKLSRSQAG